MRVTKKVWYKWPQNYYNSDLKPWYKIARGLAALPFILLSFALFYFFVVVGHGLDLAEDYRKEIF